ncbi:hypothetical protein SpCBS45565_g05551 [Spizellomyces sp. 'palustris']|nr:hypothetical protein SpCBS45565_g05551 [Spizellomyces sp. 'palustris']
MSSKSRSFQAAVGFGVVSSTPDRQTSRIPRIVFDEAARRKAQERHLEELQQDNYAADIPDAAEQEVLSSARKKRILEDEDPAARTSMNKRQKRASVKRILLQKKNLATLIQESNIESMPPEVPTYLTAAAAPSRFPPRKLCSVCGYFSQYNCMRCGMRYCSITCRDTHNETRCLKYTA